MPSQNMSIEVVSKREAVDNLCVWQLKGLNVLHALRVFEADDGGLMAGFAVYSDEESLLVAESMNRAYDSHRTLFGAIGALLDAMPPDYDPLRHFDYSDADGL